MLTLPLVCKAFGRACDTTSVLTLRLGSRLCLVADMLEAAPTGPLDDWSLGHAWGALQQARAATLCGVGLVRGGSSTCSRLQPYVLAATWGATIATKRGALLCHWGPTLLQAESLLLAAPPPPCSATYRRAPARLPEAVAVRCIPPLLPEAEVALRVVALRCAAHARAPPRSPPAAEALFARELAARETAPARRTAEQQQQRWSGERSLRNELQRSLQPQLSRPGTSQGGGTATGTGTAAPGGRRKADTKALFAHELAGRDHAAREAGRQAQKQHEAAARRQWHKLGGPARSAWEKQAAHEQDRWRRHCQGADTAAELAARLVAELQQEP